eukprot:TRINITY_DN741_c0_g1_i3.p1 TRINITY_DN741_c0_g1~~TRINITY_DN741_c0_g1_i3.p1  ORF type:complete len:392 (+),score=68.82 TRINITY_DN741_c0_g1_i3:102-1277(+)
MFQTLKKYVYTNFLTKSTLDKDLFLYFYGGSDFDEESVNNLANIVADLKDQRKKGANLKTSFDVIRKKILEVRTWRDGLKAVFLLDELFRELTADFHDELVSAQYEHLFHFQGDNTFSKDWMHAMLIRHYYKYIWKKAVAWEELMFVFVGSDVREIDDIELLYKISNLLSEVLQIREILKNSYIKFKDVQITRRIGTLILDDCIRMYNIICKFVQIHIYNVFEESCEDKNEIYELYVELIRFTKDMSAFAILQNHMTDSPEVKLTLFQVDLNLNRKIELYMNELRGNNPPANKYKAKNETSKGKENFLRMSSLRLSTAMKEEETSFSLVRRCMTSRSAAEFDIILHKNQENLNSVSRRGLLGENEQVPEEVEREDILQSPKNVIVNTDPVS